jgi:hypothetical protein
MRFLREILSVVLFKINGTKLNVIGNINTYATLFICLSAKLGSQGILIKVCVRYFLSSKVVS